MESPFLFQYTIIVMTSSAKSHASRGNLMSGTYNKNTYCLAPRNDRPYKNLKKKSSLCPRKDGQHSAKKPQLLDIPEPCGIVNEWGELSELYKITLVNFTMVQVCRCPNNDQNPYSEQIKHLLAICIVGSMIYD